MNLNATLVVQLIFFAVFVLFSKKYVWTELMSILDKRRETIADGLAAAEKGQAAEQEAQVKAEQLIAEAKSQAGQIVANAEKRGNSVVDEAKENANSEKQRILASADAEIEQEVHSAREGLRTQVSSIAVAAASKIVSKEIDANAHNKLLEELIEEIKA